MVDDDRWCCIHVKLTQHLAVEGAFKVLLNYNQLLLNHSQQQYITFTNLTARETKEEEEGEREEGERLLPLFSYEIHCYNHRWWLCNDKQSTRLLSIDFVIRVTIKQSFVQTNCCRILEYSRDRTNNKTLLIDFLFKFNTNTNNTNMKIVTTSTTKWMSFKQLTNEGLALGASRCEY